MPTYEYKCTFGHEFEEVQKITDDALTVCPVKISHDHVCEAEVRRLISGGSFILKGSGWAKDGYSSGGEKKPSGEKKSGGEKKSSKPKEE